MKLNQKGITLVELVAALALVSIIATIAWSALTIGMKHGAAETNKTIMQQEANVMISSLMAAHRGSEKYSIIFEDDQLKVDYCDKMSVCGVREISTKYNFTGSKVNGVNVDTSSGTQIIFADLTPEKEHTKITLKITDLNNAKRTLTIDTTLSRLLTNQN
ncbi:PulJ/GspJ family protein [Planomicrobium okeanokoites]|uniref:PulJ/GspJ family protein n=1 Tax=Planomicrobium okeanokoites TaxID=244 RepID=UPI0035617251